MKAQCPICEAENQLPADTQITEIINCAECENRLVVTAVNGNKAELDEAPEIEEDWGE